MPEPQVLRFFAGREDPDLDGLNASLRRMTWHEEQILSFDAIPRANAVVEIAITYQFDRAFRILDSSPAQGTTLADDSGEAAPSHAYIQASRQFDPSVADLTGAFTFNGTEINPANVVIESDGQTVNIDLTGLPYNTDGTKTISATPLVIDSLLRPLEQGYDLTWHIENFTNIQAGLRTPPAAIGRQGYLRVARIAIDHGADIDMMVKYWQDSLALTDKDILHKIHVPGRTLDTRVFILYFEKRQPNIVQTFPTSGSVMARDSLPDRLVITTDLPLHPDMANESGVVEIDGVGVDSTPVTLSIDGRTLEVDLAGFSGAGHHHVRLVGLRGVDGLPILSPVVSSYTFSSLVPTDPGAGGAADHGALTGLGDDDHTQYHNDTRGDARYYTQAALDAGQLDNRYYTETESDATFTPLSDAGAANGYATLDANQDVVQEINLFKTDVFANLPSGVPGQVFVANDGAGGLGGDPVMYIYLNP